MFGFSLAHILVLLVVVLIFGGSKRLPEMGASLGKGLRNFKKSLDGLDDIDTKHSEKLEDKSHSTENNPENKA